MIGVKGFSALHGLKGFNIIRGVAVDYMHCVLLGVVKMLLHLWFDKSQKGQPYFCGNNLEQAEKRLLSIKPTMSITRTPRSIDQHRKYWKGMLRTTKYRETHLIRTTKGHAKVSALSGCPY